MTTLHLPDAAPRVRDLISRDLATVADTASYADALSLMHHLGVRHLPVLGPAGLVGVLHEPSPVAVLGNGKLLERIVRDVPEVHLSDDLAHVQSLLGASPCGAVVVMEAGRLVGILTSTDLMETG